MNQDGRFDQGELLALFLAEDPEIQQLRMAGSSEADLQKRAADRVVDVLTFRCDTCTTVPPSEVVAFFEGREWAIGPTRKRIGWKTLAFRRFVTDTADPRQLAPDKRPFLFSYKRDNAATDKDQVNVLGGVQLVKGLWTLGDVNVPRHFLSVAPGIEMDIDGSKKSFESSVDVGMPVAYEFSRPGRQAIAGFVVSVTPKFLTDRGFDRSGWETVVETSVTASALGRMGYTTWLGRTTGLSSSILAFYWRPSFRLEAGEITDAAGNTKLAVLAKEGRYLRPTPRLAAVARFERWLPALTISDCRP